MGSYGIGPSRLAAALIEANHDDAGMIWPDAAAPFDVGVINLKVGDAACDGACKQIDRRVGRPGARRCTTIATSAPARNSRRMDLIGLPCQIIVGPKGLGEGKVEIKNRRTGERELVSLEAAIARLGGWRESPCRSRERAAGEESRDARLNLTLIRALMPVRAKP